ncbi:MAG: CRISPR-associated helicase Cas3' [Deltaproteobacteria bacterium]|nr:CRISPR-associated helicase Cas3' [Deltaproteobacteria bacterium]
MPVPHPFYAHSLPGQPTAAWQTLADHLENVARLASEFARPFSGSEFARILGQYHDIGKATLPWQAYLRHANGVADDFSSYYTSDRVEHAIHGARKLFEISPEAGKLFAYCIAGHHGGIPNWHDNPGLREKLHRETSGIEWPPADPDLPSTIPFSVPDPRLFGFQLQFFVRMLFSCLVDADYLDTEAALDPERSDHRHKYAALTELIPSFWERFNVLRKLARGSSTVNRCREQVLADCLAAAGEEPGLFSLTVPTGGGKTLASLAFALEHARAFNKRRIIYIIPFTSIIEQNAAVFRQMLGEEAVLEHHCNFVPDEADWLTRLAIENWDAPVVVTTNVQFFDSFYSNRPSRCRKLHNVADSVIIFDEVQAIPVDRLRPCLEVIRELSLNYGVTSVLCTATQPAIRYSDAFPPGLKGVREIVKDVPALFTQLKRTAETYVGSISENELADRLLEEKQVLCIVNTRQQALDIFNLLPRSGGHFHLSALMYPAHRSRMLSRIRQRLRDGRPCRVVSTQLIEAGVDVDFSCVYRAVSGIDSIAQAAGRCNRNGFSRDACPVYVFSLPTADGPSFIRQAAQSAQKLFELHNGDLTSPQCVSTFFSDYFWKNQHRMDQTDTLGLCLNNRAIIGEIQFRELAEFRMIKTATVPIVVAVTKKAADLVRQLSAVQYHGRILRQLQQYTVQLYPYQLDEIGAWLEQPIEGILVLRSPELYSKSTGLRCKPPEGTAFFG